MQTEPISKITNEKKDKALYTMTLYALVKQWLATSQWYMIGFALYF